jgi:hypothetical protein
MYSRIANEGLSHCWEWSVGDGREKSATDYLGGLLTPALF